MEFEQKWKILQNGITKVQNLLEGLSDEIISSEEYMKHYITVYEMCGREPGRDFSEQLYVKYREVFEEYIASKVLPSLMVKKDNEAMLRELVKRWKAYKTMLTWILKFPKHLDLYYISLHKLPTLKEVGFTCFISMVYRKFKDAARDFVIPLISKERRYGEQIDQVLLKDVISIFVEIGMDKTHSYEHDFEAAFLKDASVYYLEKASHWIVDYSFADYLLKVEECLEQEKLRVSHYLHSSTELRLLELVRHQLLSVYAKELLDKENSGCYVLLRDEKVEDLLRVFRLFSDVPGGLNLVSIIFKQQVIAEGQALVKLDEQPASNTKIMDGLRKIKEKCMMYINNCFQKHSLFHKSRVEALAMNELKDKLPRSVQESETYKALCAEANAKKKGYPQSYFASPVVARIPAGEERIQQFETGVYVTYILCQDGAKVFKGVRFSKRRFHQPEAANWWNENKHRVLKRYSPRPAIANVSG